MFNWKERALKVPMTRTTNEITKLDLCTAVGQVRYGAYAGAARRRVHLATVLPRPPSGHRPGRRQARHARILQTWAIILLTPIRVLLWFHPRSP